MRDNSNDSGNIFDIQRFSQHDGPGLRTTVFLCGCPLRCEWCHNPEGLDLEKKVSLERFRCIKCNRCFRFCPNQAHVIKDEKHIVLHDRCNRCGKCIDECASKALTFSNETMSVSQVIELLQTDKVFYDLSGGGVTFSGGEPFFQREFLIKLLKACQENDMNCAVETSLAFDWKELEKAIPFLDLIIFDIKHTDENLHREKTGFSTRIIMENVKRLSLVNIPTILRVPLIRGFNDNSAFFEDIANLAKSFSQLRYIELLPYHGLGEGKYEALGIRSEKKLLAPDNKTIRFLCEIIQKMDISVKTTQI